MDVLYFYYVCHSTKWNQNFKYKTILILISHAVTPASSRGRRCCNKPRALHVTWWCELIFLILSHSREGMNKCQQHKTWEHVQTLVLSLGVHKEIIYGCLPRSVTLPLTRWSVINHARENSSSQQRLLFTSLFSFLTQYFNTLPRSLEILNNNNT